MYDKVQTLKPNYNTFDLSHDKKMTLQMGKIVPVMAIDVLPGDKFTIETSHLTRLLPLASPVMHNLKVKVRYFFSPNRLVWDNWEDFITGPESASDTVEPVHPFINTASVPGSLPDYMGVNTYNHSAGTTVGVNALPFAHYQFIWNEYFRDQNLQSEVNYKLVDGQNIANLGDLTTLRNVAWQHDRFTKALPFTQKGPEVTLPILNAQNGKIPLSFDPVISDENEAYRFNSPTNAPTGPLELGGTGTPSLRVGTDRIKIDVSGSHYISGTNIPAATVNQLREAFAIQKWLELNARTGNRYTEHIQAHFGVKPQDSRLQRPEEFGGSVSNIEFSEVLQQGSKNDSEDSTPLGTLGGHGITASGSPKASYYAQEHGWIFAFMYVVPDTGYFQGVPRKFNKIDRYDYFQPLLAHIGEQPVYRGEIYADGTKPNDEAVFGYLPIYDEYRHELSSVHGLLKTDLNFWHMARNFANPPQLNSSFITADPTTRIFVDMEDVNQVVAHVYNKAMAQRKIPYYGTPLGL
jgi:hypothetical protein